MTARPITRIILTVIAAAGLGAGGAYADDVDALIVFQPDTPARADEVNQNFEDLRQAVNSKQDVATAAAVDFQNVFSPRRLDEINGVSRLHVLNLTTPAPGMVIVQFHGQFRIDHQTFPDSIRCEIERDGELVRTIRWEVNENVGRGRLEQPMSLVFARQEPVAGTREYQVSCFGNGTGTRTVLDSGMTAIFSENRF